MSGSSIRAYFAPLETWLDKQIEGETIGWDKANGKRHFKLIHSGDDLKVSGSRTIRSPVQSGVFHGFWITGVTPSARYFPLRLIRGVSIVGGITSRSKYYMYIRHY